MELEEKTKLETQEDKQYKSLDKYKKKFKNKKNLSSSDDEEE